MRNVIFGTLEYSFGHFRDVVLLYVGPAFEVAEAYGIVESAESARRKSRERC